MLCSLALAACTDTLDEAALPKPLSVAVNARDITARAPIHGTALSNASSIGISLLAEDGTAYDGVTYANLKYTASGTAPDQTWSTPNIPTLSSTSAKLVAYYPWADGTDYTAVPVETDTQTDYMYSGWVSGLSNASPNASIVMQHALTAVRVALVKGDFTADVDVSSVSVKSPAFATAGSLDATTGALSGLVGTGEAVTVTTDFPLTAQATNVEVMAVPDVSVAAGVTTVTTQIGDRKYSVNINFIESYKQGYIYTYTLTLNNTGMEVTSVAVTPWQEGTTGSGDLGVELDNDYIVKIEVPENGYTFTHNLVDFVGDIDWGDGTTSTYTEVVSSPTHIYTTAGEYTVTAMGAATALNNSEYETAFTELVYIGEEIGISSMKNAFAYAENLEKIHPGALDGCKKVTDFYRAFFYCEILSGIPAGLFDNCTEAVSFDGTFYGCKSITEIPVGLFDNCTKVTTFQALIRNSGITSIPSGLFDNCTEVTTFNSSFATCKNLVSIPTGLFDKNTKVTNFAGLFSNCKALASIPAGLFDYNTKVTDFTSTFYYTAITEIPEGLFDKCIEVTNFQLTFDGCGNLLSIPENIFRYNIKAINFEQTFMSCKSLINVPAGLFDNNTKVTNFAKTFMDCTALTSESPYTIINVDGTDVKVHLYERSSYPEHFTAPTDKTWCFRYSTALSDYNNIPSSWK